MVVMRKRRKGKRKFARGVETKRRYEQSSQ